MRDTVDLTGRVHKTSQADAGTIRFDSADTVSLWQLRCRVGRMLSAARPAYRRALRRMPTPRGDTDRLPEVGYARMAPPVDSAGPVFVGNRGRRSFP